jgi:NCS1 family nucleobase:cation symporter-1
MENMFATVGVVTPAGAHTWFALLCIGAGTFIAYKGPVVIKWTTRLLVPALLAVGVIVVVIAFTSVPLPDIVGFTPDLSAFANPAEPYMLSLEANIAFAISWTPVLAAIPRLCKREKSAYWGTLAAYGGVAPFFIFAGGVLGIVSFLKFGEMNGDPTFMLARSDVPWLALLSLILVAFANIGTEGVGSYMNSIVVKGGLQRVDYRIIVLAIGAYEAVIVLWGQIMEYFSVYLSISGYIYAALNALLFVDFFFLRKQRISLRSAYEIKGGDSYRYSGKFNLVSFACLIAGTVIAFNVYNPLTYVVESKVFYILTASGTCFLATGVLYFACSKVPALQRYLLKDRAEAVI